MEVVNRNVQPIYAHWNLLFLLEDNIMVASINFKSSNKYIQRCYTDRHNIDIDIETDRVIDIDIDIDIETDRVIDRDKD